VKKSELDKRIAELAGKVEVLAKKRDSEAAKIGNIVDKDCKISLAEVSPVSTASFARMSLVRSSADEDFRMIIQ